MALVPLTNRAGFPATTTFDANYVQIAHNLFAGASGAPPDLSLNFAGAQVNNPPYWQANVIDGAGGIRTTASAKALASPASAGIQLQASNEVMIVWSITLKQGDRLINNTATTFPLIYSLGPNLYVGHGGSSLPSGATVQAQLGLETNASTWQALESGAVSRSNQTLVGITVWCGASVSACGTGQASGTIRTYIDNVHVGSDLTAVNDTSNPSQITVMGAPNMVQSNYSTCDCVLHEFMIATGEVTATDVTNATTYENTKLDGQMGTRWTAATDWDGGQSNDQAWQGISPSGTAINGQPIDINFPVKDRILNELLGTPGLTARSEFTSGNSYLANTSLLCSNYAWTNSTTANSACTSTYNNLSSATPSAWTQITTANTQGSKVWTTGANYAHKSIIAVWDWLQGENDANDFPCTTCNWNVTGNIYVAYTRYQLAALYQSALTQFVSDLRTLTGNSALVLGVHAIGGSGAANYDLMRMAQLEWVDQNPSLGFTLNPDPWQTYYSDASSPPHYAAFAYPAIGRYEGRVEAGWLVANGLVPAGGRQAGPSHWKAPQATSVVAVHGNHYIDVLFSNPNSAGSLIVQANNSVTCTTVSGSKNVSISGGTTTTWVLGDPIYMSGAIAYHNNVQGITDSTHFVLNSNATSSTTGTCTEGVATLGHEVWMQGNSYGGTYGGTTTTTLGAGTIEITGYELTGSQVGEILTGASLNAPFDLRIATTNAVPSAGNKVTWCYGRENTNLNYMVTGSLGYTPGFGRMLTDNSASTTKQEPFVPANDNINMPVRAQPECLSGTSS